MTEQEQKAFDLMREALIDIKYGLEGSRIWGGMDWTYNPLHSFKYLPLRDKAEEALTAANAVIDHFRGVTEMVQPIGWYSVSRDGIATLCLDRKDAEMTAKNGNKYWPKHAPYRAVQLCEFEAHPQATEPASKE